VSPPSSKYSPLADYLAQQSSATVKLSLADIESLLGAPLPQTAWLSAKWWCNEDPAKTRHVQSRAWMRPGFRAEVNLATRTVYFHRFVDQRRAATPVDRPFTRLDRLSQ
jgi:hypothetical protein